MARSIATVTRASWSSETRSRNAFTSHLRRDGRAAPPMDRWHRDAGCLELRRREHARVVADLVSYALRGFIHLGHGAAPPAALVEQHLVALAIGAHLHEGLDVLDG